MADTLSPQELRENLDRIALMCGKIAAVYGDDDYAAQPDSIKYGLKALADAIEAIDSIKVSADVQPGAYAAFERINSEGIARGFYAQLQALLVGITANLGQDIDSQITENNETTTNRRQSGHIRDLLRTLAMPATPNYDNYWAPEGWRFLRGLVTGAAAVTKTDVNPAQPAIYTVGLTDATQYDVSGQSYGPSDLKCVAETDIHSAMVVTATYIDEDGLATQTATATFSGGENAGDEIDFVMGSSKRCYRILAVSVATGTKDDAFRVEAKGDRALSF